jgi:hypothetical protein
VEDYDVAALGWTLLRLSSEEVRGAEPACLKRTLDAVDEHGGLILTAPT